MVSTTLPSNADRPAIPIRNSINDWITALRMWRLWTSLGLEDLSDRYRRTVFGVSWLVTSFALFILVYITVFAQGSGVSHDDYVLHVTIGFGLWTFIGTVVSDSCHAYTGSSNWILGASIPYPVFIFQAVFRNWLAFLAKLLVILAILLWEQPFWRLSMLWALPGFLVYVFAPLWLAAVLGPVCARFRDATHAVQTAMQLLFFVTPVLWLPGQRDQLAVIAKYNIITYFIDIIRVPLIDGSLPIHSWKIVILANALGSLLGFAAYALTRNRVVYWL
jgi:ABC-type polysaccharide/polyol phosphate export permease